MTLNFSIFPDECFPKDRVISGISSCIESCAVEAFFRNRTRFGTSLKELAEDYEQDESACLGFMEPEAFSFFLPLFMKFAVLEYDESGNIPESLVYKLHRMATGCADGSSGDRLNAILSTYSRSQRGIVVGFLHEMSRLEWRYHRSDWAMETAQLLREKFGLPERRAQRRAHACQRHDDKAETRWRKGQGEAIKTASPSPAMSYFTAYSFFIASLSCSSAASL